MVSFANTTGQTGAFNIDVEQVLSWDPEIIFLDFNGMNYLDDSSRILRPANLAPQAPGVGWGIYETRAGDVAIILACSYWAFIPSL